MDEDMSIQSSIIWSGA